MLAWRDARRLAGLEPSREWEGAAMMRPQTFAMAKQPNVVLRPAAGSKFALKEKFVQIYEAFFTVRRARSTGLGGGASPC